MINRATGEISFQGGFHILPHCTVPSLLAGPGILPTVKTQKLSLALWKRHILGSHASGHGTFEVEALSADDDRIHLVLLAHQHPFYEPHTLEDAERRTFHDGIIATDLAGQQEFTWGQVLHRFEAAANQDWLVIAYTREAHKPLPIKEVILHLHSHENLPNENH